MESYENGRGKAAWTQVAVYSIRVSLGVLNRQPWPKSTRKSSNSRRLDIFRFFDDQIHAMPVDDLLDVFNGDLTARMTHFGKYDVLIDFHVFEAMPCQISIIDIKTSHLVNGNTEPERG